MKNLFAFILTVSMVMGIIPAFELSVMAEDNLYDLSGGAIRIESGTSADTIKVIQGTGTIDDNIPKETQITITGTYSNSSSDGIYVAPGVTANIILCNANINSYCAFNMSGAIANLELAGENTIKSNNSGSAGLRVPTGASVTIFGGGTLTARGGGWGTGIGGNSSESGGNITINSGTITVYGGSFGAGIGGGSGGLGGNITINGGNITAYSNSYGAGIGGGDGGAGGNIIINDGIIATYGNNGAGIGSGYGSGTNKDGNIIINGGTITATSSTGAGIGGGGYECLSCPIAINGGTVTANSIGGTGYYKDSTYNGAFTMDGNAVVFASSVSDNSPKSKGILFEGNSGVMYGNVTVEQNVTISNNMTLALYTGTLTIAASVTLTNNGTILLGEGTSVLNGGTSYGILTGSGQMRKMVTITEILGVAAPMPGATPVTTVTETSQYTGTVKWSPNHSQFKAGTGYTTTITLAAKPSFVLTGVPANFFKVAGATAVNSAGSGVITAVFSATDVTNNLFDISEGPIRIENGSSSNTIKIKYGKGLVKDYLSPNTLITITGNYSGDSNSLVDAIYVSQVANIKLNNVNISVNASNRSAFNIDGGSVILELIGENTLKSGSSAAGLRVPAGSLLTINGTGGLTSTGGSNGAGIGGNSSGACGAVTINGGIVVTAQGTDSGMGIGRGSGSSNGGTLTMNGNAIVFASSLSDNSPKIKGILFNGNTGVMYGDVTVEQDVSISNKMSLALYTGTLTIATGVTLTNNGMILLGEGTSVLYGGDTYGILAGSGQTRNMVTIAEILGVPAPVPGEVPTTTVTETTQYTGTVKWLPDHNVFQKGTSYTATITLTAKPDFVLTSVPANFFTVSGATAVNSVGSGVITAVFSETNVANSIFDITGGAIRIEKGTNTDTIKVLCGGSLVKDNIPKETQITITGTYSNSSGDGIYVAPGVTANIMLCNANISSYCAFNMFGAIANLELAGENTIKSNDSDSAGLRVPTGASVTIFGGGTLTARGGVFGAGIGGSNANSAGNITINSGTIIAYSRSCGAGIGGGDGESGGNIIINDGIITTYGSSGAGIGGGSLGAPGNIIINGGTITASGGDYGAGIGSGRGIGSGTNRDGNVTINGGTITATGRYGAAIGAGGYDGLSCPITIKGGVITATSIGGTGDYKNSTDNGAFTMDGNAVVFANSISDASTKDKGILFIGNSGTVYGSVALEENATIPSGRTLTIPSSSSLIIPEGMTLINNSTVINRGRIINNGSVANNGEINNYNTISGIGVQTGNQPIHIIDMADGTPPGSGNGWIYTNSVYTVLDSAVVLIKGTSEGGRRIEVAASATANITLYDVSINGLINSQSPLLLNTGVDLTLTIVGKNFLKAGNDCAGIQVPDGATLTIDGYGMVTAEGGWYGAGIGSRSNASSSSGGTGGDGVIIINDGTVIAKGGYRSAGIGGGGYSDCGTIEINGGKVEATGGYDGAGIGSYEGICGRITINDGTVTATGGIGGSSGAGIGGGSDSAGGIIEINGGTVTATGSDGSGAGIGGGGYSSGGTITINNGIVIAKGDSGAGIGGGSQRGNGGTIKINNGMVKSTSNSGAGIGGGEYGNGGNITINNGTVEAISNYASGIGSGQYGGGGNITISGGIVKAVCNESGYGDGGAGIGNGDYINNDDVGTFTMDGNCVLFTSSVNATQNLAKGILFIGSNGTVYGSVTLENDVEVLSDYALTVLNGAGLTIPEGVTLTNNGTVTPANGSSIVVLGEISGNKICGSNVAALLVNNKTHNSISLNAAELLAVTGQNVEYAYNTSDYAPLSGWQNTPDFIGLTPSTTYYFFTRSKDNANFRAGAVSSLQVQTYAAADITKITTNEGGTAITITFSSFVSATVITTFYDEGRLIGLMPEPITQNGEVTDIDIPAGTDKIKVIIWDGLNTMQPLCEPKTVDKDDNGNWITVN